MKRGAGVHGEKRLMASGGVLQENGAQDASMCPSYRSLGREVGSTIILFLMDYTDSPHVHLENN